MHFNMMAFIRRPDWPRTPRALAGRLRRAQTSLRALGIDIAFQREGRAGSRIIRMRGLSSGSSGSAAASTPTKQDFEIKPRCDDLKLAQANDSRRTGDTNVGANAPPHWR
jgi:hypothetical protein